jgi:hypothetical protein
MKQSSSSSRKKFPLIPVLVGIFALGLIAAASGFVYAGSQEAHDSFCASCHTQPETTFYARSTAGQAVDLASYHQPQQVRCIDCHSGRGLSGRLSAEMMGANNALKWYTGTAVQPAVLKYPIGDQNCLKCHQDVTQRGFIPKEQITVPGRGGFRGREGGDEEGGTGHWHRFLARWQSSSATAGSCVSCHSSHTTGSTAQAGFMSNTVEQTCDACHRVLRREGGGG